MATLLNNATSVGAGAPYRASGPNRSFQAVVSGTGAVSATIIVEGSNDVDASANPQNWLLLGTITLSGTNSATDGFPSNTNWMFVRMRVSAISGTNATVRGGVEVS